MHFDFVITRIIHQLTCWIFISFLFVCSLKIWVHFIRLLLMDIHQMSRSTAHRNRLLASNMVWIILCTFYLTYFSIAYTELNKLYLHRVNYVPWTICFVSSHIYCGMQCMCHACNANKMISSININPIRKKYRYLLFSYLKISGIWRMDDSPDIPISLASASGSTCVTKILGL